MSRVFPISVTLGLFFFAGCLSLENLRGTLKPLEDALVFIPVRYPIGKWHPKDFQYEDAWFTAEDGNVLHGWFCEVPNPRAVVLYCHGNAGNVAGTTWKLRLLAEDFQVSVLAFDYRGFGKSEGKPNESGILLDARAARRWLAQRTGVAEKDIVLMGYSLGGGVAVDLAAKDGARGLILENTFTSVPDVPISKIKSFPAHKLMHTHLNSLAWIGQYKGPLLQTHGDRDLIISFELGKKLFAAANEPKEFITVPGGGHEFSTPLPAHYLAALRRFFDWLPASEN